MFKKWLCLLLAAVLCCGALSLAEEVALDEDALILDEADEEIIVDELLTDDELIALEDIELNDDQLVDGQELSDETVSTQEDPSSDQSPEASEDGQDASEEGTALEMSMDAISDNGDGPRLTLSAGSIVVGVGDKCKTLTATLTPANDADTITWSSSDSSIARVNSKSGEIKGKAVGTAVITARAASGLEASCNVRVVDGPSKVSLAAKSITIGLKQTYDLAPRLLADDGSVMEGAKYTVKSSKKSSLSVTSEGVIKGLKTGSYTVTVTSKKNNKKAKCKVKVVKAPSKVTLSPGSVSLKVGETQQLTVKLPSGTMASYTFTSSDTSVASVDADGVVTGLAPGKSVIKVKTHNSKTAKVTVTVTEPEVPTGFTVTPATVSAPLSQGGVQLTWSFGEGMETRAVTFTSEDESVATVSSEGYVTFVAVGSTQIVAETDDGQRARVDVTILKDEQKNTSYRLFAAYSFYDSSTSKYNLPFAKRNASGMATVFGKSSIDGNAYATKVMGNPSKSKLLSGISSFFEDTDDDDVSIVYLCSHGHNNKSSYSSYTMVLEGYYDDKSDSDYILTAKEIFNSVKAIRGNVILIIDSCYSGTFINDMEGKLDDQNGRIAVLTAASNTRASYYNNKSKAVDFFTYFLLQGLGYNEKEGWWNSDSDADEGSYPGYLSADRKGNGDGAVTLAEFYNFASNCIDVNIPRYMNKSWFWGDTNNVQKTRFYAGNLKNLVIYVPK